MKGVCTWQKELKYSWWARNSRKLGNISLLSLLESLIFSISKIETSRAKTVRVAPILSQKSIAKLLVIDVCVDTNCDDESNIASLNNYKTDYEEYTANLISTQKGYKIVFNIK